MRALQPSEALAAAEAGLALPGAGPVLRRERAEALAALGRGGEALADLDAALEAMPRDLPGLRLRARLRAEAGDIAGALADAGRVTALDERDPAAWLALGEAQVAADRPERARESFLRAIARDREGQAGDRARRALQLLDGPGEAPVPAEPRQDPPPRPRRRSSPRRKTTLRRLPRRRPRRRRPSRSRRRSEAGSAAFGWA